MIGNREDSDIMPERSESRSKNHHRGEVQLKRLQLAVRSRHDPSVVDLILSPDTAGGRLSQDEVASRARGLLRRRDRSSMIRLVLRESELAPRFGTLGDVSPKLREAF